MSKSGPVVAVDGPAGSGKSTASKVMARAQGWRYLDTGALYRALTWWMLEQHIDVDNAAAVAQRAQEPVISITCDPDAVVVRVDGRDVSAEIRGPEVAAGVSAVSRVPEVRERLVAIQRELIGDGGIVVEGRDIGTVVAPDAPLKLYVTATPEVRARRRNRDFGRDADGLDQTLASLQRRDAMDSSREHSPLSRAEDAVEIDTSEMTLAEVVRRMCDLATALTGDEAL